MNMFKRDHMKKRLLMCLLGMTVCAVSVSLFKAAVFGVDPFQSLLAGLDCVLPLSFGTISLTVNLLILVFTFFADRHFIGLGTIFNMLLSGYIIGFATEGMKALFPNPGMALRIVFLLAGIVIMCLASAIYITADLGVSSYDSVALIISGTWKKGKFKYVRIACDFVCVASGVGLFFLSGGKFRDIGIIVGAGTIVTAFFMGPLIDLFRRKIAEPMLNR